MEEGKGARITGHYGATVITSDIQQQVMGELCFAGRTGEDESNVQGEKSCVCERQEAKVWFQFDREGAAAESAKPGIKQKLWLISS